MCFVRYYFPNNIFSFIKLLPPLCTSSLTLLRFFATWEDITGEVETWSMTLMTLSVTSLFFFWSIETKKKKKKEGFCWKHKSFWPNLTARCRSKVDQEKNAWIKCQALFLIPEIAFLLPMSNSTLQCNNESRCFSSMNSNFFIKVISLNTN